MRWWLVTRLSLRGRDVAVAYDAAGDRYGLGAGLHVWLDGEHVGSAAQPLRDGDHAPVAVPPRVRLAWDTLGTAAGSRGAAPR